MRFTSTPRPEALARAAAQRGFSIVAAIFLLVVLSGLGAFILSVSSAQHASLALDVQGSRAYQAARTGVEWAVYQLLTGSDAATASFRNNCRTASYASATSTPPTTTALQNLTGMAGTLNDFTVTVACGSGAAAYSESGSTVWVYQVQATACNQPNGGVCPNTTDPGANYVERQLRVTLGD